MKTLILYHGTLTSNVEAILRDGLCPRGTHPSHDQYLHLPSLPEFVYLAASVGCAMSHAVRISERVHSGAPVTVLQVTLSNRDRNIHPDEDYLMEEWAFYPVEEADQIEFMKERRYEWRRSLKKMKAVAYLGAIEARRIYPWDDVAGVEQWHRNRYSEQQAKLKELAARNHARTEAA
jgi:hypothetical protein